MSGRRLAVEVGQLLRTSRERRGLSQEWLAAQAGITQQRLSKLERGAVDPRVGDLQRLFDGLRLRLRLEAVPAGNAAAEDPDLLLSVPEHERWAGTHGLRYVQSKLHDLPHLVGGRLAALILGMPVQVRRLDLIIGYDDRELFDRALGRFSAVRWSDRWQEFRDYSSACQPGPMRWLISGSWELRVTLMDDLPQGLVMRVGDRELRVPPLPWLIANDPDVADLLERLTAAGWDRRAVSPGAG